MKGMGIPSFCQALPVAYYSLLYSSARQLTNSVAWHCPLRSVHTLKTMVLPLQSMLAALPFLQNILFRRRLPITILKAGYCMKVFDRASVNNDL